MFIKKLKAHVRQPSLKVVFAALSLALLVNLAQKNNNTSPLRPETNKQVLAIDAQKEIITSPVRLIIPKVNVDASIIYVGLTSKGAMEVPNNAVDVGWFKFGSRPGEKGSAVIAGHFDGQNGEAGVFTHLNKLTAGDRIYIQNDNGTMTLFTVRESRTYDPGYAEEVFSANDGIHLNLVTCDGLWDGVKKNYSKRLVVFADIAR